MDSNWQEIYGLLLSGYFFAQVWNIPMTWVFGLLCGAVMQNALFAFGVTHLINIVGVIGTYTLSKKYGSYYVQSNEKFKPYIASLN